MGEACLFQYVCWPDLQPEVRFPIVFGGTMTLVIGELQPESAARDQHMSTGGRNRRLVQRPLRNRPKSGAVLSAVAHMARGKRDLLHSAAASRQWIQSIAQAKRAINAKNS